MAKYRCPLCNETGHASMKCPTLAPRKAATCAGCGKPIAPELADDQRALCEECV